MATITVKRKAYKRKAYTRKNGTRVKASSVGASSFSVKDRGKPGRTPTREKWFAPRVTTGWSKDLPQAKRIRLVVKAHKGDLLASARSLRALANVSTDRETKQKASADATILFARYK